MAYYSARDKTKSNFETKNLMLLFKTARQSCKVRNIWKISSSRSPILSTVSVESAEKSEQKAPEKVEIDPNVPELTPEKLGN